MDKEHDCHLYWWKVTHRFRASALRVDCLVGDDDDEYGVLFSRKYEKYECNRRSKTSYANKNKKKKWIGDTFDIPHMIFQQFIYSLFLFIVSMCMALLFGVQKNIYKSRSKTLAYLRAHTHTLTNKYYIHYHSRKWVRIWQNNRCISVLFYFIYLYVWRLPNPSVWSNFQHSQETDCERETYLYRCFRHRTLQPFYEMKAFAPQHYCELTNWYSFTCDLPFNLPLHHFGLCSLCHRSSKRNLRIGKIRKCIWP